MWYIAGILLAVMAAVLLVLLAVMKEVVVLQEKVTIYRQLLLRPARPSYIGAAMPANVRQELAAAQELPTSGDLIILFLRPDCSACNAMVNHLSTATGLISDLKVIGVIGRGVGARRLIERVVASGITPHPDTNETLFDAAEIRSTPTMLRIDLSSETVIDYAEGSDVEWLRAIQMETATNTPG